MGQNTKKAKFIEAIGRRKEARARVRLSTQGVKEFSVNQKPLAEYFKSANLRDIALSPVEKLKIGEKFGFSAVVSGGGMSGQAEAVRQAIARALVLLNPYFKKRLKKLGFLKRDPRMRERKKFGLKRARRAPQWSKR
ncbi:MAG: 30S ribosomal protein S9 [Patescibacteria group bacterium]|nr:30S ribosomal protein S9 [Patescibacteria group bacterium]